MIVLLTSIAVAAPALAPSAACGLGGDHPLPPLHAAVPLALTAGAGPIHRDPFGVSSQATSERFALRWDEELVVDPAAADQLLAWAEGSFDASEGLGLRPPTASETSFVNIYLGNSGPAAPPISFVGGYVTVDREGIPYIVLHPDLMTLIGSYDEFTHGVLEHEFFHVLQFSTSSFASRGGFAGEGQGWLWESTASWFAHHTLPDNQWVPNVMGAYPLLPHVAVDFMAWEGDGLEVGRQYHSALFQQHLSEHVAGPDLIVDAWGSDRPLADPLTVYDELLQERGTSLDEAFVSFATHNAVEDYALRAVYADWTSYYLSAGFEDLRVLASLHGADLPSTVEASGERAPRAYGYQLIEVADPPDALTLTLHGSDGSFGTTARFLLGWVGDADGRYDHHVLPEAATHVVEGLSAYDRIFVAVTSQPRQADPLESYAFALDVGVPAPDSGGTAWTDTGSTARADTGEPSTTIDTSDSGMVDGGGDGTTASDDGSCGCQTRPSPAGWAWLVRRR